MIPFATQHKNTFATTVKLLTPKISHGWEYSTFKMSKLELCKVCKINNKLHNYLVKFKIYCLKACVYFDNVVIESSDMTIIIIHTLFNDNYRIIIIQLKNINRLVS